MQYNATRQYAELVEGNTPDIRKPGIKNNDNNSTNRFPFWLKALFKLYFPFRNPERGSSHHFRKNLVFEFSDEPECRGVPCFVLYLICFYMSFPWEVPSLRFLDLSSNVSLVSWRRPSTGPSALPWGPTKPKLAFCASFTSSLSINSGRGKFSRRRVGDFAALPLFLLHLASCLQVCS